VCHTEITSFGKKRVFSILYFVLDEKRKGGRERKKKGPGGGALVSQMLAAREAEKNRINEERINQVLPYILSFF
jgi:hypothetical protein